jgi:hypothetical protein
LAQVQFERHSDNLDIEADIRVLPAMAREAGAVKDKSRTARTRVFV